MAAHAGKARAPPSRKTNPKASIEDRLRAELALEAEKRVALQRDLERARGLSRDCWARNLEAQAALAGSALGNRGASIKKALAALREGLP